VFYCHSPILFIITLDITCYLWRIVQCGILNPFTAGLHLFLLFKIRFSHCLYLFFSAVWALSLIFISVFTYIFFKHKLPSPSFSFYDKPSLIFKFVLQCSLIRGNFTSPRVFSNWGILKTKFLSPLETVPYLPHTLLHIDNKLLCSRTEDSYQRQLHLVKSSV